MNFKTTLVLVAVVLVVGAVWMLVPSKPDGAAQEIEPPRPGAQFVLDPQPEREKLSRIEIARAGKPRIVFERVATDEATQGDPDWRIIEPIECAAERHKVSAVISTFAGLQERARYAADDQDVPSESEAGLDPPTAIVTFVDLDGHETHLEIGKLAVMSSDTYVRTAVDGTIHLANRDLLPQVKKGVGEYRSQRLADLKVDDAVRVEITHAGQTYDISRGAGGDWVVNEPVRAYADWEYLRGLLTKFNALRAAEFVDDTPAEGAYGLGNPHLTWAVTTETRRKIIRAAEADGDESAASQPAEPEYEVTANTHELLVGGFADLESRQRCAQTSAGQWVAAVAAEDVEALIPDIDKLRDPRVARVQADDITEFEITFGDVTISLEKTDGTWRGTGDLAELEETALTEFLDACADLKAISYVDAPGEASEYGLDAPRAIVKLTTTGSLVPVTLRIGQETASGRNAYLRRDDEPSVIVTRAAAAARVAIDPITLRGRGIFTFDPQRLQALGIERDPLGSRVERVDDGWRVSQPADAPADADNIQSTVTNLAHLRAKQVVIKEDDGNYALRSPIMTLHFELSGAEDGQEREAHALYLARKLGHFYARRDADTYVFELDESVFDVLTAELVDTRLFSFATEDVIGFSLAVEGRTLELVKRDDGWTYPPDPYVELNQDKVRKLVDALAEMRVEGYLAWGDADMAAADLVNPPVRLVISLAGGQEIVVAMSQDRVGPFPRRGALPELRRMFLLRQDDAALIFMPLEWYLLADEEG